ncbi:MAG: oxygenase MpaB family protein [Bacteroidota bacterium]
MITTFTDQQLAKFRTVGDKDLFELLKKHDHRVFRDIWSLKNDEELFSAKNPQALKNIVEQLCILPDWFKADQFQQSESFFTNYMQDLMMMLGLVSLPYCYGGADGSKVLVASGRIHTNTTKRLMETGTFVWDVCTPGAFSGKGKGFLSCLKVRLIHQFTRDKLLKDGWDSEKDGYPVNQLDQAGTNLSFSLIAIRAIRKTGKSIANDQMEAYIHRWNVISSLLGLQDALVMDSVRTASMLSRAIERIQFRKSEEGLVLTKALMDSIFEQAGFSDTYKRLLPAYMGFLIGEPTAKYLNLDPGGRIKNMFEFNGILSSMKSIFPWLPALGFDNPGNQGAEDIQSFLAEIPMLR